MHPLQVERLHKDIREQKEKDLETETWKMPCEDEGRNCSDTSISQRTTFLCHNHSKPCRGIPDFILKAAGDILRGGGSDQTYVLNPHFCCSVETGFGKYGGGNTNTRRSA